MLVTLGLMPFVQGDVGWYDSGELTAATAGLGVPHPTGFPLLVVLGHALQLLPFGPVPFRVALLSAASVGLATGLVHATAVRLGARPGLAALGALLVPVQLVVWTNAVLVEVYAPTLALGAGVAFLLGRPEPAWRQAAVLTGLGLGAHVGFVLMAGALWLGALTGHRAWPRLPRLLPWGLVGGLVILALPLMASRDPWMNWGDPSTPGRLLDHLTAASIRGSFEGEMGRGGAASAHRLGQWAEDVGGPFAALAVVVVALAAPFVRPRWFGLALLGALALDAAFTVWVNPMGQAELQTGTPGVLALASLAALALGQLPLRPLLRGLGGAIVALVLAFTLVFRWEERPTDEHAGRHGRLVLSALQPGALLLATSDHLASQSLYLQGVEAMRPDVVSLVIQHLHDGPAVARRYAFADRAAPEAFLALPREQDRERVAALLRAEGRHGPVYWQLGEGRYDGALTGVLRDHGLVERLAPPSGVVAGPPRTTGADALYDRLTAVEPARARTRWVWSEAARLRGLARLREGALDPAARLLEEAMRLDPNSARANAALGAVRWRQGQADEAIDLLERAVRLDPTYAHGWRTLATYREAAGDPRGAQRARDRLEAL